MSSRAVAKNAENEICGTLLATFNRASAALDEALLMSSSLSSLQHPFLELCHWAWGAFSTRMVSLLCFNNKSRRWTSSQLMWWWYPTEAIKKLFCHLKLSLDRYHSGADVTVLLGQESGQESFGICIIGQNNSGRRHREFASELTEAKNQDAIENLLQN